MRKRLGMGLLAIVLWGCQSDTASLDVGQEGTRVSVSVGTATPSPSGPATPSPSGPATPSPSGPATPAPEIKVDVEAPAGQVRVGSDGVQVKASQGVGVKVDQNGVVIDTSTASVAVSGASSNQEEGDKLVIDGVGDKQTYAAENKAVEVNGTGHHLKLTGSVTELEVNGTSNTVEVDKVAEIEVNGTGNQVLYAGPKPKIQLNGLGNQCQPR